MSRSLYFFLAIAASISIACGSTRSAGSREKELKAIYMEQFKLTYFRQLLLKTYNRSGAVNEIISNDHSGFSEPILSAEDHRLIDSLTTVDNNYLILDSTEGRRRAEGSQGKRPLQFIMKKLNSKWLDSLAKSRLKDAVLPGKD